MSKAAPDVNPWPSELGHQATKGEGRGGDLEPISHALKSLHAGGLWQMQNEFLLPLNRPKAPDSPHTHSAPALRVLFVRCSRAAGFPAVSVA